jgi:hypothetical protein
MENYNENVLKLRVREQKLKEELEYWETEFVPSGNMGKWGRQTKLDKLKTDKSIFPKGNKPISIFLLKNSLRMLTLTFPKLKLLRAACTRSFIRMECSSRHRHLQIHLG